MDGRFSFRGYGHFSHFIIQQHSQRRRIQIILLPGFHGPEEGPQEAQCQQQADTNHKEDNVHDLTI